MPHQKRYEWSPSDDQKMAQMISAGLNGDQIAHQFGVSRNAITGRIHRNKERRVAGFTDGLIKPMTDKILPPLFRDELPDDAPKPWAPLKELRDLGTFECRYPVDEDPRACGRHLFCGKAITPGQRYCGKHSRLGGVVQ